MISRAAPVALVGLSQMKVFKKKATACPVVPSCPPLNGQALLPETAVPASLQQWIGRQLRLDPACWPQYAEREATRREHLLELRAYLGIEPFGLAHYRQAVHATTELALQTDKGIVLANSNLDSLRHRHIILPTLDVIEGICAEAIMRGHGHAVDDALLQYLSPLGREHINLTGDYLWRNSAKIGAGKFRPLRPLQPAWCTIFSVF